MPWLQELKLPGPGTEGEGFIAHPPSESAAYLGTASRTAAEAEPVAAGQGNQAAGTVDTSDLWIKNLVSWSPVP